jgi:hypothetical protein
MDDVRKALIEISGDGGDFGHDLQRCGEHVEVVEDVEVVEQWKPL